MGPPPPSGGAPVRPPPPPPPLDAATPLPQHFNLAPRAFVLSECFDMQQLEQEGLINHSIRAGLGERGLQQVATVLSRPPAQPPPPPPRAPKASFLGLSLTHQHAHPPRTPSLLLLPGATPAFPQRPRTAARRSAGTQPSCASRRSSSKAAPSMQAGGAAGEAQILLAALPPLAVARAHSLLGGVGWRGTTLGVLVDYLGERAETQRSAAG